MFSICIIYFFFLFSTFIDISYESYCRCECCAGHDFTRIYLATLEMGSCDFCLSTCESTYPHLYKPEHMNYKRAIKCGRDPPGPTEDL